MNRRINSILFIIAATIANIVVMMILFVVLLVIFARFVAPSLPPQANQIMLMVLFVSSVIATYVIYHRVVRRLGEQYDLQKHFGPIFGKDHHPPM